MERPSLSQNSSIFGKDVSRFGRFRKKLEMFASARKTYYYSYRRDPLARMLIDRMRLSPLGAAGIGLGLVALTYILGLILRVILKQEIASITQTAIDWLYDFSLIPLTFGYYVWIATAPGQLLVRIGQNGVMLKQGESIECFSKETIHNWLHHPAVFLFGLAAALGTALIYLNVSLKHPMALGGAKANYWIFYFMKVPVTWMIPWYMVCVIFLKETIFIMRMKQLLAHPKMIPDLLNQDRCGGLKPISDYLFRFTTFIAACGFGFVLLYTRSRMYGHTIPVMFIHGTLVFYLFLSGFFFFFPLHPVHKALTKYKQKLQNKLPAMKFLPLWCYTPDTIKKLILATLAPVFFFGLIIIIFPSLL